MICAEIIECWNVVSNTISYKYQDRNCKNMFSQEIEDFAKNSVPADSSLLNFYPISYTRDELISLFWQYHPRFRSFKVFPTQNSTVLDLGSGSGGLYFWKEYLPPFRSDLKMAAVDLYEGPYFKYYEQYSLINLDESALPFPDQSFDFIISSHLIEHVADWKSLLVKCDKVLKPNGIIYIETPSKHTIDLPVKNFYIEKGFPCQITNFFDDGTHTQIVDLDILNEYANSLGFVSLEKGFCKSPFLEDMLLSYGHLHKDEEVSQYGLWSKLLFSSYIILQKT